MLRLFTNGKYAEAERHVKVMVRRFPKRYEAWQYAYWAYGRSAKPGSIRGKKALNAALKATEISKTADKYWHRITFVHPIAAAKFAIELNSSYQQGLDLYRQAKSRGAEDKLVWTYWRGVAEDKLGRKEAAKEAYEKFIEYYPQIVAERDKSLREVSHMLSPAQVLENIEQNKIDKYNYEQAKKRLAKLNASPSSADGDHPMLSGTSSSVSASSGPQGDVPQSTCCYHIWAAGCNLGWATSLLKFTTERTKWCETDNLIIGFLNKAGEHVIAANSACSKLNPAWPQCKNKQRHLTKLGQRLRKNPIPRVRLQIMLAVKDTFNWHKALKKQVYDTSPQPTTSRFKTCADKYFSLGFRLSFAQHSLKVADQWGRYNRKDWRKPIGVAFDQLWHTLKILDVYYLVTSGTCVELKDLGPHKRIFDVTKKQPTNKSKVASLIFKVDKLCTDIQTRMINKCGGNDGTKYPPKIVRPHHSPAVAQTSFDLAGTWRERFFYFTRKYYEAGNRATKDSNSRHYDGITIRITKSGNRYGGVVASNSGKISLADAFDGSYKQYYYPGKQVFDLTKQGPYFVGTFQYPQVDYFRKGRCVIEVKGNEAHLSIESFLFNRDGQTKVSDAHGYIILKRVE